MRIGKIMQIYDRPLPWRNQVIMMVGALLILMSLCFHPWWQRFDVDQAFVGILVVYFGHCKPLA